MDGVLFKEKVRVACAGGTDDGTESESHCEPGAESVIATSDISDAEEESDEEDGDADAVSVFDGADLGECDGRWIVNIQSGVSHKAVWNHDDDRWVPAGRTSRVL